MTIQGGKTYEKWNAYGQSKTANILFSIGLAKRFGDRGVLSYSLNPGAIMTNLGAHLDFAPGGDLEVLGRFWPFTDVYTRIANFCPFFYIARVSRMTGSPFGFEEGEKEMLTHEQGIATHVFASFDPVLKGMLSCWFPSSFFFFWNYFPSHPSPLCSLKINKLTSIAFDRTQRRISAGKGSSGRLLCRRHFSPCH